MRKAERETLDDLYRHYAKALYYYLLKLSGSEQLAEDLTQETFLRATISLSYNLDGDTRAWLFKVARNAYIDEWRRRKKRSWIPFADYLFSKEQMLSPYGIPEDTLIQTETKDDLLILLNHLPEQYRTIIYLREYEQFQYKEIAEILDQTESQIKVTLHRARKKLAEIAEKKGWRKEYDHMDQR